MSFIGWFLWGEDKPTKSDNAIVTTVAIAGLGALLLCFGVNAIN